MYKDRQTSQTIYTDSEETVYVPSPLSLSVSLAIHNDKMMKLFNALPPSLVTKDHEKVFLKLYKTFA